MQESRATLSGEEAPERATVCRAAARQVSFEERECMTELKVASETNGFSDNLSL